MNGGGWCGVWRGLNGNKIIHFPKYDVKIKIFLPLISIYHTISPFFLLPSLDDHDISVIDFNTISYIFTTQQNTSV